ncbi:hypothetical protein PPL_08996 [Heterostelium album PN500]|uniref:Chalcone isomerase domain-containing protein n=1 Tax=Heterostelium pallidum (strain ATCC 26659 / Pp 5 / PN500) TaxID=670386 RepID=D3BKB5_HETP5|nr:hypothetical protein PPL_08996 [Heterostelium album PN500]EFA78345.1 hypothetical protein PPL_08996 [Heterostelium album PN500]|eukprot:XP_020430470.1 hypothetical protein PPL_08996 [Heterostelium album PN500]
MITSIGRNSTKLLLGRNNNNNKYLLRYSCTNSLNNNSNNNYSNNNNNDYQQKQQQQNRYSYTKIIGVSSLALLLPSVVLCKEYFEDHEDFIVQIKTGYQYPKKLINKDNDIEYSFVNIGTRVMSFMKINVYSMGVYIDELEARLKLGSQVERVEQSEELTTQSELDFIRTKSGELLVLHDQQLLKKIENNRLSSVLFEFYLGDYTKVPEVRQDFFEQLYNIIKNKNDRDITSIGIH